MAKLIYTNSRGDSIELGQSAPFFITDLEGFSNVDNIIDSYQSVYQDGESVTNTKLSSRHLTIQGEFLYPSRQEGRNKLIRVFNPKLAGTLRYENYGTVKEINCIPERTPVIGGGNLSTAPYVINLYASNPFWMDTLESKTDISTEIGNFSFPLHIPPEGLELSIRTISFITNIYNPGDVETPIRVSLKATGTVENPTIENLDTGEFIRIKRALSEGDTLEINTAFGNKRVEVIKPDGTRENVFHYIDYQSKFFSIDNGDTRLKYDAEVGNNNLDVSIYYTPRYLGI